MDVAAVDREAAAVIKALTKPELSARIAQELFGYEVWSAPGGPPVIVTPHDDMVVGPLPDYSGNITEAWKVVAWVQEETAAFHLDWYPRFGWKASNRSAYDRTHCLHYLGIAQQPEEAICRLALFVKGAILAHDAYPEFFAD